MATFDLDFEGWNPGSLSIIVAQIVEYLENHPIYDPETGYTYSDLVAGNNLPAMVTDTELTQNEKENAYAAGYRFVYDTSLHEAYFLVKVNGILSVVDFPGNDFLDKADIIISSASGAVASFTDGADNMPMESVVCSIEPVQDLNGYDHPWAGGAGKNLLPTFTEGGTKNYLTWTVSDDGTVTINGTASATTTIRSTLSTWQWDGVTQCWLSGCPAGGSVSTGYYLRVDRWTGDDWNGYSQADTGNGKVFSTSAGSITNSKLAFTIVIRSGTVCTNLVFKPMLNLGSSAETYEPYSNICPITGHTGLTLSHSDADTSNPTTLAIDWTSEAGTVYGGTLDVVSGVLTVKWVSVGNQEWSAVTSGGVTAFRCTNANKKSGAFNVICNKYATATSGHGFGPNMLDKTIVGNSSNIYMYIRDDDYADATAFTAANADIQFVYELKDSEQITVQLTPQQINSLLGTNNLWHNANGNTSVSYRADTKLYIDAGLAGKQDTLTFDSAPVQNSTKPVTSGGLYTAFSAKQDTLTFDTAPVQSSTKPVTSGGLYTAFSAKQDTLTFDSAPVQNSIKPVTSGGLYTAFSAKQDALVFDQVPQTDSSNPVTSDGIKTALDLKADLPILEVRSYDFSLTIPAGGVGYTYTNEVSGYTCIGCRAVISSSSSPLIEVSCPVYISSQVQARILNIGSGSSNDIVGTMYFYFIKDSYIQ